MKKIKLMLALLALLIITSSCHNGKHVTISTNTNGEKTTLEYYGKIAFTDDNMGIKSMSPDSYVSFEDKGERVIARREHNNNIVYELSDGTKTGIATDETRHLIAEVLKRVGRMDKK